jgi:hypothetical protein
MIQVVLNRQPPGLFAITGPWLSLKTVLLLLLLLLPAPRLLLIQILLEMAVQTNEIK